jgi:DNA-directed RNA polymerase subunit beta'
MRKTQRNDFSSVMLKVASPDRIKAWSYGEILKPETINYRTGRSERGGLFDERVFGPEKNFECYCGKYKRIRYKDIVCEKCGVQVTEAIVRRDRMGHIELATPIAHIWFLRGSIPAMIPTVLGIQQSKLEKVIYFASYIVTSVNEEEKKRILKDIDNEFKDKVSSAADDATREKLRDLVSQAKEELENITLWDILDEGKYYKFGMKYSTVFTAAIGAEAIYDIFKNLDLKELEKSLKERLEDAGNVESEKLRKRLSVIRNMIAADVRPEWMFFTSFPVIPPGMRPMVMLEGGRHATSDINDLYRRVINRNNRLKKLKEISAPEVILRNEKRILQEAVDALIDNGARGTRDAVMNMTQKRQLKSLADNVQGKYGLMRQNLLGKRVDYSGRSVIVVGPTLNLNECGLPKHMALELFKPFVMSEILRRELAHNPKGANKLIEEGTPEVWAILEQVIKGKYVLLNRAPTLHRLGIQAFLVRLIEGNAIQLHPLVCPAFNADFDGDQMAVHVPISEESQTEARELLASNRNILKPGDGNPVVQLKGFDIILGIYWMTKIVEGAKGEGAYFHSPNAAILAHENNAIDFRAKIKVMPTDTPRYKGFDGKVFETTVGRLLFNSVLPSDYHFINNHFTKSTIGPVIDDLTDRYGINNVWQIFDRIKNFSFKYSTISGTTFSADDVVIPLRKREMVEEGKRLVAEVEANFQEGFLSEADKYKKNIEIWQGVRTRIEKSIPEGLVENSPVKDLLVSGARGSIGQLTQMVGMKGLIQNSRGITLDFPIVSNYKEGLSPIEYFVTTYGARKGGSDTALKTASAGYFTRKLVDVAQDVIIKEEDCGTKQGKYVSKQNLGGIEVPLWKSIWGRVIAEDVIDSSGKTIFKQGYMLKQFEAKDIEKAGVEKVKIYTPLLCQALRGLCQKCYGIDMGRGELIALGEAVGIIAAQAIGEPGTQLTMRTFHQGGVAGFDITQGLPRVVELFERRMPKSQDPAVISPNNGEVLEISQEGRFKKVIILLDEGEKQKGKKQGKTIELEISPKRILLIKVGDKVAKGEVVTDGSADLTELYEYAGIEKTQEYIAEEVTKVYEMQGASISRKHLDIIIRQMFSRCEILDAGDTRFTEADVVPVHIALEENAKMGDQNLKPAEFRKSIMGISNVSLSTDSWISSSSFQNTTRVLIRAAVRGAADKLEGLKENVTVGRLIPAGTGFKAFEDNVEEEVGEDMGNVPEAEIVERSIEQE